MVGVAGTACFSLAADGGPLHREQGFFLKLRLTRLYLAETESLNIRRLFAGAPAPSDGEGWRGRAKGATSQSPGPSRHDVSSFGGFIFF